MEIDLSRYRVKLAETDGGAGGRAAAALPGLRRGDGRAGERRRSGRRGGSGTGSIRSSTILILESLDPAIADPLDRVVGVYRLMRGRGGARPGRGSTAPASTTWRRSSTSGRRVRRARAVLRGAGAPRAGRRCTCSGTGSRATCWSAASSSCSASRAFPAPIRRRSRRRWPICTTSTWRRPTCGCGRCRAHYLDMDLMPREAIDAPRALQAIPPLIKAYLRLGGLRRRRGLGSTRTSTPSTSAWSWTPGG